MSQVKAKRLLHQRIQRLAVVAESVRQAIVEAGNASDIARSATRLFRSIARQPAGDFTSEEKADTLAQSVVCFATAAKLLERTVDNGRAVLQWLERSNPSLKVLFKELQSVAKYSCPSTTLAEAVTLATDDEAHDAMQVLHPGESLLGHFYEFFLHQYQRCRRKKSGVYYTPQAVVSYIVRRVDVTLQQRFELPLGLAESDSKILDPAMGTGLFLVEAIRHIHATVTHQWQKEKLSPKRIATRWKKYVVKNLLPRLSGYELMLAPFVTAHLNLAAALAATGFDFQQEVPMQLEWKDTLAGEEDPERATVIIGNPPFSGISSNMNPWIEDLLKGRVPVGENAASYYSVDGQPLGEKKLWLQDDYVKFLRYAQWRIELAARGVIGFVTNHGYLDNPTFRGMRHALTESFEHIEILDLHGNVTNRERTPDGDKDMNVFEIQQGVAVSIFCRTGNALSSKKNRMRHGDLWGIREEKFLALADTNITLASHKIQPQTPFYLFRPNDESSQAEYENGTRLRDAMQSNATAPVTARDHFVVAFEEKELIARVAELRDRSISDESLREKYFNRTRSTRYPAGDSRGWKLPAAREQIQQDANWKDRIVTCQYRPFDRRAVYWTPWMIDWPRPAVSDPMLGGKNLAIVARRSSPASQSANYFWVTDLLALDGIVRSDTRGGESLFPLYTDADARSPNFSPEFIETVQKQFGIKWQPTATENKASTSRTFNENDLFHLFYAQLHSPRYRERYAAQIRMDFPRVFIPKEKKLFRQLASLGEQLVATHLLQAHAELPPLHGTGPCTVEPGYPKYANGRLSFSSEHFLDDIPSAVWQFRVGSHQVCHKWLKDRRRRILSSAAMETYRQIIAAIIQTLKLTAEIDHQIDLLGGWPRAFVPA